MLRRIFTTAVNSPPAEMLISQLEENEMASTRTLRVLTYHRVMDPAQKPERSPTATVTPAAFDQQMQFVRERYCIVSIQQVLEAIHTGKDLPQRPVLITFDDAYQDFAENALPVLQRYQLPVTLFVPTAFPDHPERVFWWDQLYNALSSAHSLGLVQTPAGRLPVETADQRKQAFRILRGYVKSLPHHKAMAWVNQFCEEVEAPVLRGDVLSWDQLRQIAQEGVALGAHTQTHPLMSQVSSKNAREEIAGSVRDLNREIGEVYPIFAYPSGGYTPEVFPILQSEGIQLAFTTDRGHNRIGKTDSLQLKRINVGPGTSLSLLRGQLLEWTNHIFR